MTASKTSSQDGLDGQAQSSAMAAPTEPALGPDGLTPAPLNIKRATLYSDTDPTDGGSAPLRHIESYVGFVLDGRYHIESIIAQGGMGVVYLARHRLIDKHVAVKILRPELANNREITARFLTEAQAASAIGSEHIVNITDYGELPDGATYIVMEYLNGLSLNQRIRRSEAPLPIPVVLDIARQIAEGLQRAHDANIVHRDLKPDNILLISKGKRDDFVKILDFGIAKVQSSQNHTTTAGRIFGTPHYMSPEQGRGQELNHRTDIYSLGVILYEMVCGNVPFDGENPLGILTQHMYVEVKPLSERCAPGRVTPALECVIARCLEKEPAGRYSSMSELDDDLRRLQEFEPPLAVAYFKSAPNPPSYLLPILRRAPLSSSARGRWFWSSVGALTVMLGIGLYLQDRESPMLDIDPLVAPVGASSSSLVQTTEVTIVAEPIDAHIFEGDLDLGVNPHTLHLEPNQVRSVTVRRAGFRELTLTIDGTKTRVEAKLRRLTGTDARTIEAPPSPVVAPAPPEQPSAPTDPTMHVVTSTALTTVEPESEAADTREPFAPPSPVLQPPDAIDPAWGYAPDPPGPPPSAHDPDPPNVGSGTPPQLNTTPEAPSPPGPPPFGSQP
jgi:eukaryotic-like serine/threonine-protein kinase